MQITTSSTRVVLVLEFAPGDANPDAFDAFWRPYAGALADQLADTDDRIVDRPTDLLTD